MSNPKASPVLSGDEEVDALFEFAFVGVSNPPRELFHYTSADAVRGILSTGGIWATHLSFFNDTSEWSYGHALAKRALAPLEQKGFAQAADVIAQGIDDKDLFDFYVACFCEDGDLIPQWRGYGAAGAGYAIGFDTQALAASDGLLLPVLYDSEWVLKSMSAVADRCANRISEIKTHPERDRIVKEVIGSAITVLVALIASSKNRLFEHEREWRLLYPWKKAQAATEKAVSFRSANGILVPFVELRLGEEGLTIPLSSVRCGPTLRHESTELAVRMLLTKHGLKDAKVLRSEAPLRA
jgi:hypothetical protein